jgi:hypothetical protein
MQSAAFLANIALAQPGPTEWAGKCFGYSLFPSNELCPGNGEDWARDASDAHIVL